MIGYQSIRTARAASAAARSLRWPRTVAAAAVAVAAMVGSITAASADAGARAAVAAAAPTSQQGQYEAQWGPAVGTQAPLLDALDQSGKRRTLADLTGEKGLLLVFSRSADW